MMRARSIAFATIALTILAVAIAPSLAFASGYELEPNDTAAQATPIACNCTMDANILSPAEADYFTFSISHPNSIQIYTTIASGDSVMSLLAADGSTSLAYDDDNGVGLSSHIGMVSLAAGTYYIRVQSYFSGSTFSYTLALLCPNNQAEAEPNNSIQTANALACEALGVAGNLDSASDIDYFRFNIAVATGVSAFGLAAPTIQGDSRTVTIAILNSTGATLATVTDGGGDLGSPITTSLNPGTYYLRVSGVSAATHYDVSLNLDSRVCSVLNSIVPTNGTASGGDLVFLSGDNFGSTSEVSVRFGGVNGTVVSATPNLITARTPAGTGTVDVTVISRGGALTLPAAFTFVSPEIAARYGNVNAVTGTRESPLLINTQGGDDFSREMTIGVRTPISILMLAPSSRLSARFCLYVWLGAPTAGTLTALPRGLGSMVLPPPFMPGGPHPLVIFNNAGFNRTLGAPTYPSHAAPTQVLNRTRGARNAATVTFQGLIQDNASLIPEHWSVTNAIILNVR